MTSNRFSYSANFLRQYASTPHPRQFVIINCVDKLENGDAAIVDCPEENRSYTETTRCRIYFNDDVFLEIEFV